MIILDTHTILWLTEDDSRLSSQARSAIVQGRSKASLAICDISLSEIARQVIRERVKVRLGVKDYLAFVERMFRVLPIDGAIAEQSVRLPRTYPRDPADRLIGATAIIHEAKLVTADTAIRASGKVECIW